MLCVAILIKLFSSDHIRHRAVTAEGFERSLTNRPEPKSLPSKRIRAA